VTDDGSCVEALDFIRNRTPGYPLSVIRQPHAVSRTLILANLTRAGALPLFVPNAVFEHYIP
jgi:hypothetical protein